MPCIVTIAMLRREQFRCPTLRDYCCEATAKHIRVALKKTSLSPQIHTHRGTDEEQRCTPKKPTYCHGLYAMLRFVASGVVQLSKLPL